MRLFFKHLKESIKRRPLQPIVLLLTLTVAVGVCIMSLGLSESFDTECRSATAAEYGSADMTVTLNSESKSRFMFVDEVEKILGEMADVVGTYEVPMLYGNTDAVFGVAVDLFSVQDIFNFSFSEYGEVTRADCHEAMFISSAFAKRNSLSVGDSFEISALGGKKSYTVEGISPEGYLNSYDVMVDVKGVIDMLASNSLFVSALGDSFRPCSTLYIDVRDGYSVSECKELLSKSENYSDKSFFAVAEDVRTESDIETMQLIVNVAISFALILSVAVTFCCFYILGVERSEENSSFRAAGARSLHLNLLQYAEILLYWLVGGALGIGFAYLLLGITVEYANFRYAPVEISMKNIFLGLGLILISSLLTATAFILSGKKEKRKGRGEISFFTYAILLLFTVGAYLLTFLVPIQDSFLPGLFATALVYLFAFVIAPPLLKLIMKGIDKLWTRRAGSGKRMRSPSLRYAVKNLISVRVLHNFSRLISLLTAVLLSCFLVILSADGYVLGAKEMLRADYVVLNSTETCYEKLSASENVHSVSKSFFGSSQMKDGRYTPAISVESADMLCEHFDIEELPHGNEAVISIGQAEGRDLKVGDTAKVLVDGKEIEVVIKEIKSYGVNAFIFDSEHFGFSPNLLLVNGKEGEERPELLMKLAEELSLEVAAIVTPDSLMRHRLGSVDVYLDTGDVLLTVAILFALVGMLDNLSQSYRHRLEEFDLYRSAGMSKRSVGRMKLFEVTLSLLFGILHGTLAFGIASFVIDRGLSAYGYKVYHAIAMLFI